MRLLPVSPDHLQNVPLSNADFYTWVLLDTFDMYSPAHDPPQGFSTVAETLEAAGFVDFKRQPHGAISVTATRA